MPGDRLALAVGVGREVDARRGPRRGLDLGERLALAADRHVLRLERRCRRRRRASLFGRSMMWPFEAITEELAAEELVQRPRFGRRLDDRPAPLPLSAPRRFSPAGLRRLFRAASSRRRLAVTGARRRRLGLDDRQRLLRRPRDLDDRAVAAHGSRAGSGGNLPLNARRRSRSTSLQLLQLGLRAAPRARPPARAISTPTGRMPRADRRSSTRSN